jgi:hypothetical protein
MPIAFGTRVKDYPAVYRNPQILRQRRYDLVRIVCSLEEANRAGTRL